MMMEMAPRGVTRIAGAKAYAEVLWRELYPPSLLEQFEPSLAAELAKSYEDPAGANLVFRNKQFEYHQRSARPF